MGKSELSFCLTTITTYTRKMRIHPRGHKSEAIERRW